MPIKGLTEKRRLPRVGKIHLGIMATKNKAGKDCTPYPKAVDYFVFPQDHPQYQELIKTFGEKPKELRIVIPVNNEEQFASQYYRCYSKTRGLICKGSGETAMRTVDTQTGALVDRDSKAVEMKEVECQGRKCSDYQAGKCRETMNLQFLLPEITGLGIWQIDTSSINSIRNINGAVSLIKAVHGRVAMFPLLLTIEKIEVTPPGGKKKPVWVMNLKSPTTLVEAAKQAMLKPLQLIAGMGPEGILTPVPDDERPELITHDWEGLPGDPPRDPMSPEESAELAEVVWPPDVQPSQQSKEPSNVPGVVPKTQEELFEYIREQKGWKNTDPVRSWLVNKCRISEEKIDKDIPGTYYEVKELNGWSDYEG